MDHKRLMETMDVNNRFLSTSIAGTVLVAFAGCHSAPEIAYDPIPRQWVSRNTAKMPDGSEVGIWFTLISDGTAICSISSLRASEYKKTKLYRYSIEGSRIILNGKEPEADEEAVLCGKSLKLKLKEIDGAVVLLELQNGK